jgi:hypothetical protein
MEYDNIFHYFKGASIEDSHNIQIENNVTKALVNVLQHSPRELTDGFFRLIDNTLEFNKDNRYSYTIQVTDKMDEVGLKGYLLGIAEDTRETYTSDYTKKKSIPDAAIVSADVAILIETKIGNNVLLDTAQIEKHQEKFHESQVCEESIQFLTWKKVREYFNTFYSKYPNHTSTGFLIRQFEQFCEINGIGGKTREHYFNYFPLNARKLAKELDKYLLNSAPDIFEPINTRRGIAYKRNNRRAGFGKLCTDRRCLILRFGSKGSKKGEEVQREIDKKLGKKYIRSKADRTRYTHESYIDLRWVKDLEQIKPFILKSYEMTP